MLAQCRRVHLELPGDQQAADAVPDQIPVNLHAKMLSRLAQPVQYLQAAFASQRMQCECHIHLVILLTNKLLSMGGSAEKGATSCDKA
jgi:hypothetical protein